MPPRSSVSANARTCFGADALDADVRRAALEVVARLLPLVAVARRRSAAACRRSDRRSATSTSAAGCRSASRRRCAGSAARSSGPRPRRRCTSRPRCRCSPSRGRSGSRGSRSRGCPTDAAAAPCADRSRRPRGPRTSLRDRGATCRAACACACPARRPSAARCRRRGGRLGRGARRLAPGSSSSPANAGCTTAVARRNAAPNAARRNIRG